MTCTWFLLSSTLAERVVSNHEKATFADSGLDASLRVDEADFALPALRVILSPQRNLWIALSGGSLCLTKVTRGRFRLSHDYPSLLFT